MCDEAHADVGSAVFPGSQDGPLMHTVAGKAVDAASRFSCQIRMYV